MLLMNQASPRKTMPKNTKPESSLFPGCAAIAVGATMPTKAVRQPIASHPDVAFAGGAARCATLVVAVPDVLVVAPLIVPCVDIQLSPPP